MIKLIKSVICVLVLVASLGFGMITEAGRIPSHMVPLYTYATKKVTCYLSAGGTAQGWIDPGDYVIVNQINSNGWAKGTYPVGNKRIPRWFRIDDLLYNPNFKTLDRMSPVYKIKVYKNYSYNGEIGSVSDNEDIWVVSNLGDVWQIVYKVNGGGYKMGWVPYWDCLEKTKPRPKPNPTPNPIINPVVRTSPISNEWRMPVNTDDKNYRKWGAKRGDGKLHVGADYFCKDYKALAVASGVVYKTGYQKANGNFIIIKHNLDGRNVYSFYAHLAGYYVKEGQNVKAGDEIGKIGNTGTGSNGITHIHFALASAPSQTGGYYGYLEFNPRNNKAGIFYNPAYVFNNKHLP